MKDMNYQHLLNVAMALKGLALTERHMSGKHNQQTHGRGAGGGGKTGEADGDANKTYQARQKEAQSQIKSINSSLGKHAKEQARDSKNWGFVGDIEHVSSQLGNAQEMLGGRRPTLPKLTPSTTANQRYKQHQNNVQSQIKDINTRLDRHSKRQSKNPGDWGFAGDLGQVTSDLKEVADFLSNAD